MTTAIKLTKEEKAQLKHENWVKRVEDAFGDEYTVLGIYKTVAKPVRIRHNKCGYKWNVYPGNLLSGKSKCPRCSGKVKPTTEEFRQQVKELTNGEYDVLGEYIERYTTIKMKHLLCGHEWDALPNNFIHYGRRCPRCNSSKGEESIATWVEKNKIIYEVQYKFKDCAHVLPLLFDFALFNNQKELIHIIEYDGQHHFKPVDFASRGKEWAKEQFEQLKHRDQIKNQYCKDNNIPLLRIPYWDFDKIEEILNDRLKI